MNTPIPIQSTIFWSTVVAAWLGLFSIPARASIENYEDFDTGVHRVEAKASRPAPVPSRFRYRLLAAKGKLAARCENVYGVRGYNKVSVEELKATKHGECADLSGADLRGAYLPGVNLNAARLNGADLGGAVLGHASLKYADLSGADLDAAVLTDSELDGAMFVKAELWGTMLNGALAQGTDFTGASMVSAKLQGTTNAPTDLGEALLERADLRAAQYNRHTRLPFDDAQAEKRGMLRVQW